MKDYVDYGAYFILIKTQIKLRIAVITAGSITFIKHA